MTQRDRYRSPLINILEKCALPRPYSDPPPFINFHNFFNYIESRSKHFEKDENLFFLKKAF